MRIKLTYIAPLLAAGAAAVAIAAAPAAAAANGQTCSGNICQSPGNVQINNARPPVQFYPYGDMPFLLGGHGGLRGGLLGLHLSSRSDRPATRGAGGGPMQVQVKSGMCVVDNQ